MGPARKAKGCFLRGSQETSLYRFVSWGDRKPEGGEAEAEPRRAASAQGPSPARRARENEGHQKRKAAKKSGLAEHLAGMLAK